MKILYLKKECDATFEAIVAEQRKRHELLVIDLNKKNDFEQLVKTINESDRVISW